MTTTIAVVVSLTPTAALARDATTPGRARGASTSAPVQRVGSAKGTGHRVDTATTRTTMASAHRRTPRPPGAVPDEITVPPVERGASPAPERRIRPALSQDRRAAGFDAVTSREMVDRRDATTRVYRNSDGTETVRMYTAAVHTRRADGTWQSVDSTLVPESGRLRPKSVPHATTFAETATANGLTDLVIDADHAIGFGLAGASPVPAQTSGDTVTYPKVWPGVDLRLSATGAGIKEDLVLASAEAASRDLAFSLRLKGLTPVLDPAAGVALIDRQGVALATIPPGFMTDARGVRSTAVAYAIQEDGAGQWALRVTPDPGWLAAKGRAFPVVLDPSIAINADTDDTFVMAGHGDESGSLDLQVGTEDGGRRIGRAYFRFDQLARQRPNQYVVGASFTVFNTWAPSCAPKPVTLFEVAAPWSAATRWPGAPVNKAYETRSFAHRGVGGGCAAGWESFHIDADDATRWTHGAPFHGLSLRAANEQDSTAFKRFAARESANPPHLDVTYSAEGAAYEADEVLQPTNTVAGHVRARVTNLGSSGWPAGGGFRLGLTVKRGGQVVATSAPAAPSEAIGLMGTGTIQVPIPALPPDEYTVELNMVDPQGRGFNSHYGVPLGVLPLKVSNVAPSVNFEQPGTGAAVGTITPTLYAEGVNTDNWPNHAQLKYDFKICGGTPAAPAGCQSSGWTGHTWTPSPGTLEWAKTYYWWVRAHDGADSGPYTGPLTLTTEVPQPEITGHLAGSPDSVQGPGLDPNIGNYSTVATDASVPTVGPDLTITRTYNSLDPRRDTAFGVGWASRVDTRLTTDADGSGNVVVTLPTGRQVRFGRNVDGTFAAPPGQALTLVYESTTGRWTLRDSSGTRWIFDILGRLIVVVDAYGLTETLSYDTNDHVVEIRNDTSRRLLALTWQNNRIVEVRADEGPAWTYSYEGDRLVRACAPESGGKCTRYAYGAGSHYRSSVLDDNPRAYWRFGESGGTAAASANARSDGMDAGRYEGAILGGAGAIGGTRDRAAVFDGMNSHVNLPAKLLSRTMSLSAELWFRTTGSGVLISAQNGGPFPDPAATAWTPVLYVGTDGLLYGGFNVGKPDGPRQAISDVDVNDGRWHHAVLSAAVNSQTLYVDGKAQRITGSGVIDHRDQVQLTIGAGRGQNWPATNGGNFYFEGSIDEVAVYERPLGPLAVADHYQAATAIDQLTDITLPQDDRRYAHLTYDDINDRVRTLDDHWGRAWRLDPPHRDGSTRRVVLHGPNPDWIYTFDADHGGRIRARAHNGATQHYAYNSAGYLSTLTDENNHEARFTTDARGNVLSTTTCRTAESCNTAYSTYYLNADDPLDPRNDRIQSRSDARSSGPTDTRYRTSYNYDPAGRLLKVTYPSPSGASGPPIETWTYANGTEPAVGNGTVPAGSLIRSTGRRGQVTSHAYYATGDLAETISPTDLHTRFRYDSLGRPTEVTTANGGGAVFGTTTTTYTERSQVATVTAPAVTNPITGVRHELVTSYAYDANGNTTSVTRADSTPVDAGGDPARTTAYRYDEHDRLELTTHPDGTTESRAYGDANTRISTTDAAGTTWIETFDDQQRLLNVTTSGKGVDPRNPKATSLVLEWRSYDPAGRLATVIDAMGRLTDYTYYDDGLLATATRAGYRDPGGSTRDVVLERRTYDPAGNLTQVVEAGGRTRDYTYDAAGYLARETLDPAGLRRTVDFVRDLGGNAVQVRRGGAAQPGRVEVTDYEYGPDDQQTRADATLVPGVMVSTVTRYDERGLPRTRQDGRNFVTTFEYDGAGELVSTVEPKVDVWVAGQRTAAVSPTTTIGRNTFGEPTHQRDPNGALSTVSYDAVGRPELITAPRYTPVGGAPLTATTRVQYDKRGNPNRVTDPLGHVTDSTYDPYGNLLTQTLPKVGGASSTTRNEYTRTGELESRTDPTGAQTWFTYDELGRMITATAVERTPGPLSFYVTTTEYDDAGNPVRVISPEGHSAKRGYNAAGEVVRGTDPTDRVTTVGYDIAGRPMTITDPSGLVSELTYDLLGRPTGMTQRRGETVLRSSSKEFDSNGNVAATTSAEGRQATFGYDPAGRLVVQTAQVGTGKAIAIKLGYDAAGNRTRFVDGNNHATDYTYTPWGLPESTIEPATATAPDLAQRTWTTSYDAAGQAVSQRLPGGVSSTRDYDAQGRVTAERGTGAEAATTARDIGYDPVGRVNRLGGAAGVTEYRYDDRGHLIESKGPAGDASFEYTGDGHLRSRVDAAGSTTFEYDPAGRPTSMTDPVTKRTVDYGYDPAGRLRAIVDRSVRSTVQRVLSRDDLGRVRTDHVEQSVDSGVPTRLIFGAGYGYDRDDHVTAKTTIAPAGTVSNAYAYDGADRLVSWTGPDGATTRYGWDDAGNRTRAGATTYTYDERNQLRGDGVNNFAYSARGTLSEIRPAIMGPVPGAQTRTTRFDAFERLMSDSEVTYGYDSLDRVAKRNEAEFQYEGLTNSVISDGNRVISRDAGGAPFAERAVGATAGFMLYADEHGDVIGRYLSAQVAGTSSFDPFGTPTGSTGEGSALGYQGGWKDPASGSVNMAARWYEPAMGAFVSRDTWTVEPSVQGGGNRYAYANGDPIRNTDPTGHLCELKTRPCTQTKQAPAAQPKRKPALRWWRLTPATVIAGEIYDMAVNPDSLGTAPCEGDRGGLSYNQCVANYYDHRGTKDEKEFKDLRRANGPPSHAQGGESGTAPGRVPGGDAGGRGFTGGKGSTGGNGSTGGRSSGKTSGRGIGGPTHRPPRPPPPPAWIPPLLRPVLAPTASATVVPRPPAIRAARPDTRVIDPGPDQAGANVAITAAPPEGDLALASVQAQLGDACFTGRTSRADGSVSAGVWSCGSPHDRISLQCRFDCGGTRGAIEGGPQDPAAGRGIILPGGRTDGELVFAGHGSWDPDNGFTTIPPGTSLTFYSPHGTGISARDGLDIEQGVNWNRFETFSSGDIVPNYTLSPSPEFTTMSDSYTVWGGDMNLDEMLYPDMGPCHWAACRTGPRIEGQR